MGNRVRGCVGLVLVSIFCSAATPRIVDAQPRTWVASLNYESSRLLVPVIFVVSADDEGGEWSVGLTGWTLTADWKASVSDGRRRHIFARLTPVNANGSNFIYQRGVRDDAAAYRASSAEGGAGIEIAHSSRWTGGYRAIVMYQRISELSDSRVSMFWRRPFAGVEITRRHSRVSSDDRFGSRWDGLKIAASARAMGGTHTWSRAEIAAGIGKRTGPVFLSGRGAGFSGHSINVANAFVLGGSWDVPLAEMLPGYRYAEFRLERAVSGVAAVDIRIHGPWEIGVRGGWLEGPATPNTARHCSWSRSGAARC